VDIGAELNRIYCPNKTSVVPVHLTYQSPPAQPLGLSTMPSKTNVTLSWYPPNGFNLSPISYTVERRPTGNTNAFVQVASAVQYSGPFSSINFTDSQLSYLTSYDYRITPVGSGGSGVPVIVTVQTLEYCSGFMQGVCATYPQCVFCAPPKGNPFCTGTCAAPNNIVCSYSLNSTLCVICQDIVTLASWQYDNTTSTCEPIPAPAPSCTTTTTTTGGTTTSSNTNSSNGNSTNPDDFLEEKSYVLPNWAWIAIGVGFIILVAIIVAAIIISRKDQFFSNMATERF